MARQLREIHGSGPLRSPCQDQVRLLRHGGEWFCLARGGHAHPLLAPDDFHAAHPCRGDSRGIRGLPEAFVQVL